MADEQPFTMPIQLGAEFRYAKSSLTWVPTERDRARCMRNHNQTLERLKQRGGLDWGEMAACLFDKGLWDEKWENAEARCRAEVEARSATDVDGLGSVRGEQ